MRRSACRKIPRPHRQQRRVRQLIDAIRIYRVVLASDHGAVGLSVSPLVVGAAGGVFDNAVGHVWSLSQNRPNAVNPTTTIEYKVRDRGLVTLRIYNVAGQLSGTLVDDVKSPGEVHRVTRDGRNNAGQTVSNGVYFYRLVAGDCAQTKKMASLSSMETTSQWNPSFARTR